MIGMLRPRRRVVGQQSQMRERRAIKMQIHVAQAVTIWIQSNDASLQQEICEKGKETSEDTCTAVF